MSEPSELSTPDPGSGYTAALGLARPAQPLRELSHGERELAVALSVAELLASLPESSRRKVLATVEEYVTIPPRRVRPTATEPAAAPTASAEVSP